MAAHRRPRGAHNGFHLCHLHLFLRHVVAEIAAWLLIVCSYGMFRSMNVMDTNKIDLRETQIEGLSRSLCEHVAMLRYEDLPVDVVHNVKLLLLDTLGIIAAGRTAPGIDILHARLQRWEKTGTATALKDKLRLSPPNAALANGAAAHALDFDDIHDEARVHTSCVLVPALLASAEDLGGVAGRDFIVAMAVGIEVNARLGLACFNCLGHGWHPTMVMGVMAAAVAVARLLSLDVDRMLGALGFAHHLASGSAQSILDGALTKRIGPGFAAHAAVMAAFLASDGLSGPSRPLEGKAGLFLLQERGEVLPDRLLQDFGRHWETMRYGFKAFPCCRCCHSTIDVGLRLHQDGIRPEQVESVEIAQPSVNFRTVGLPYDASRDSVVHAQFNAAYCFARALQDGRVDLHTFQRPQITDASIAALTRRITVVMDPAMDPIAMGPVRITLRLRDGRNVVREDSVLLGGPDAPLPDSALIEKFRSCLAIGAGADDAVADRLATLVMTLEEQKDVAEIVAAFP
ncbi:MmgE/PrpD family protein [Pseudorhodoplanes sp.]|uniref:MmgE/PrpD family protein n=1 Tax=Pseudorhodoplanes sp. TaxID=1934341 RepID=UPI002BD898CB|nr:MmgE/PrpD family protein [Pseudorhodoplanes sp.]HWV55400.1 MmgE/PrpD family protein [Pseudorhodoplanes sp.]